VLTDAEKERARYHLGYMATSGAASLQLGLPRPAQTVFLLEQAFGLLSNQDAIDRVRRLLCTLDKIECKLQDALCALQVEAVDALKLRESYPDLLEHEYIRWARRLADVLGVPLYPYADRFKGKVSSGNLRVL